MLEWESPVKFGALPPEPPITSVSNGTAFPIHRHRALRRATCLSATLIGLKDQDGKFLVRDMLELAKSKGAGWYDYKWPNPINNKIEDKSSYVEKMGDYWVGVGVYR